jgi:hypothetical protein
VVHVAKKARAPATGYWAIVLQSQSIKIVPYTGLDQEGLLCFCKEGDDAWTRVANVVQTLVNHPHPDVMKD